MIGHGDDTERGESSLTIPRSSHEATGGTRLSDPALGHLAPGTMVAGRYEVVAELGAGAQARVFRVRDLELDEEVALKVLTNRPAGADEAERQIKQETRLARRIVHPNVCRIYDFGREGKLLFVTMELIPGCTLGELVKAARLPPLDDRLTLFRDILVGVRAAHALGIVHADIKPQNVMVTSAGRAVVMDFGLAGKEDRSVRAKGGAVLGTPAYIAPERLRGAPADTRSDIYALGVVLFELIAGRRPFNGTVAEVISKHLYEPVPKLAEVVEGVPRSIEVAVARMMDKDPELRYTSVDQILEVLAEIRSTPIGRTVVLAVADDDLSALLAHHLVALGLVVESVHGGEQTIEALLREKPDVVVIDVDLPGIDGFRVTEMVRRYHHLDGVPVYLLSRVRDASHLAFARQLGVVDLVRKPLPVRPFAQRVRAHLGAM